MEGLSVYEVYIVCDPGFKIDKQSYSRVPTDKDTGVGF